MRKTDSEVADLGDGKIDVTAFLKATRQTGLTQAFVQLDDSADPFSALDRSLKCSKSIRKNR